MSIKRKIIAAVLCAAAIGIVVASTAGATIRTTPGVTANEVTIGGTFPLTGGASGYANIAYAEAAYYAWVNHHGGVNHRSITDLIRDDQYDPSQTPGLVHHLVEQDNVFSIVGSLGTVPAISTWVYLNQNNVPQVLLATGDSYWGDCVSNPCGGDNAPKPWTMGWQPDYPAEGKQYAKYILRYQNNAKIGILSQNDAYGDNYVNGFKAGLGSHVGQIVDHEKYNFGDSIQVIIGKMSALEQAGANAVFIAATPTATIQALIAEGHFLHWTPLTLLNNVSANKKFMLAAESNGATPDGVISTNYVRTTLGLAQKIVNAWNGDINDGNGPNSGRASALQNAYAAGDSNVMYGLGVAYTFADALKRAGNNPTRASLMHALRTLHETGKTANPFVYPKMDVKTSASRTFPMQQLVFERWIGSAHNWKSFGPVLSSGH